MHILVHLDLFSSLNMPYSEISAPFLAQTVCVNEHSFTRWLQSLKICYTCCKIIHSDRDIPPNCKSLTKINVSPLVQHLTLAEETSISLIFDPFSLQHVVHLEL